MVPVLVAKAPEHWQTNLPCERFIDLVCYAKDAAHPGM